MPMVKTFIHMFCVSWFRSMVNDISDMSLHQLDLLYLPFLYFSLHKITNQKQKMLTTPASSRPSLRCLQAYCTATLPDVFLKMLLHGIPMYVCCVPLGC